MPLQSPTGVTTIAVISLLSATSNPARAGNESRSQAFAFPGNLIEVVPDFSENAIYWCGAGTYAQTNLSKPVTTMIYVWQGPSPSKAKPGETSVKFGFQPSPDADPVNGFTNDVSIVGNSLSLAAARQTCNERTTSG